MLRSKFVKSLMSILKRQVKSSSNFASFFFFMTLNSSANFKLIHFLFWIKGSRQSCNFETFECSGKNLPISSCHFPNHKSVFHQSLHHLAVSWNIVLQYFFSSNIICFVQKERIKVQIFETFECWCENSPNSCLFWKQISFSSIFASLFSVMRHNSSTLFKLKFYILSTKVAYQSTNLVKFHVSSRKSEILHFDEFLLSKSYKGSAKKSTEE